jgi:hypothetical protein
MKPLQKKNNSKKSVYSKPTVERIKLDKEISIMMSSLPPDPPGSIPPEHFNINPFKLPEL